MTSKSLRIFITGSEGQLGRALEKVFKDHKLFLARLVTDDITSPKIIETICHFKPEVVIHGAALTDVDGCEVDREEAEKVNKIGTALVAQGAKKAGARLIYVSTDYVFDGKKKTPYKETDPVHPINIYGETKLMGEQAVQAAGGAWTIVRTSWVYGFGRTNFVTNVLEWARTKPELKLVDNKKGSPTYTKDLALAIKHLIHIKAKGVYHVSGQGSCNWLEYGKAVLKLARLTKKVRPIKFEELEQPAARPAYTVLSKAKLKKTGFSMRPWKQSLAEFVKEYNK